jgi:hypothetical protein
MDRTMGAIVRAFVCGRARAHGYTHSKRVHSCVQVCGWVGVWPVAGKKKRKEEAQILRISTWGFSYHRDKNHHSISSIRGGASACPFETSHKGAVSVCDSRQSRSMTVGTSHASEVL